MPQAWLHGPAGHRPVDAEAHLLPPRIDVRPTSHLFSSSTDLPLYSHELFDEYTRRQFAAKMPNKKNPFGNNEVAARFADFDLFKKVRRPVPRALLNANET